MALRPGRRVTRRSLLAVFALALLPSRGGKHLDLESLASASDEVVWEAGQKAYEKKDWESARQYYKRLIDAFPQSQHQADARIALADTHFREGGTANYVLAVSSYREFLTLYPQHPRSDYAQFQAAESYFQQKNSFDRDQTATRQALDEYERLLDVYPQSTYVEQTRDRIKTCRQTLARAHHQVGFFYQKTRRSWRAAIARYQTILADFPDYEKLDEVLFRMGQCLSYAGRYAEARPHLARLRSEFPKSEFIDEADKLEQSFPPSAPAAPSVQAAGPTPAPGASPAPPTAHVVEAEVVSMDASAKTITLKGDPNTTLAVDPSAVGSLKDLKSGDKVKLTYRDNPKGEHEAVLTIAKEAP
jgi:outer membrane protein assembly factor BamD